MDIEQNKKCKKCLQDFPLVKFNKSKNTKDGRENICKTCRKEQRKENRKQKNISLIKEKKCSSCKEILPISNFSKDNSRNDGYNYICKNCKKTYYLEYSKNEDVKQKIRERTRKWKKENPEALKLYYKNNRNKIIKRTSKYHKDGFGKWSLFRAQAKKRNLQVSISEKNYFEIISKNCFYCNAEPKKYNGIDRINSSKHYSLDNCRTSCSTCNYMKSSLMSEDFFLHLNKIIKYQNDKIIEEKDPFITYSGDAKKDYYLTPFGRYSWYKNQAKKRKIPFQVEYSDFILFWQKPCAYCGSTINTAGLDRIDNNIGYRVDNINPCCWNCNNMKRDLTVEQFLENCKNILKNIKLD